MRGGKPKGASDQWMRNALASGSIVAPRESTANRDQRLARLLDDAWIILVASGLVALCVAAVVL